jgi:hypothetical protein
LRSTWIDELLLYNVAGRGVSLSGSTVEWMVIRKSWIPSLGASELWAPFAHICDNFMPEARVHGCLSGLCMCRGVMPRLFLSFADLTDPPSGSFHRELYNRLVALSMVADA